MVPFNIAQELLDANTKCNNDAPKTRLTCSKDNNKNSDQSGNGDGEQGNNDDFFLVF